jgi:hypothetical protein
MFALFLIARLQMKLDIHFRVLRSSNLNVNWEGEMRGDVGLACGELNSRFGNVQTKGLRIEFESWFEELAKIASVLLGN